MSQPKDLPYYARVIVIVRSFNPKWKHIDCNHHFCTDGNQPVKIQILFNGGIEQCNRLLDSPYAGKLTRRLDVAIKAFGYATQRSDDIVEQYDGGWEFVESPIGERWGFMKVDSSM